MSNKEVAEELHKPIFRKFKQRKVHPSFMDKIWGAYLGDMQLISKFSKGNRLYYMLVFLSVNMHGLWKKQYCYWKIY